MARITCRIQIYQTPVGRLPYEDWLNNLRDRKGRAIIRVRIDRLTTGNPGRHRALGNGLYELKISYGPGYRVYFGKDENKIIVLLCGGDKGSQKQDILQARKYWKHYRS